MLYDIIYSYNEICHDIVWFYDIIYVIMYMIS